MLSDSIKYKDLRSEKHTYKSAIGSKRIENPYIIFRQIFRCAQQHVQISRHISLVATYLSARSFIWLIFKCLHHISALFLNNHVMSVSFLLYVPLLLGLVAAYRCLRATRVMFSVGMGRHNSFVGYAACRYLLLFGNHKTNVLPDMLSGCIEYKDL